MSWLAVPTRTTVPATSNSHLIKCYLVEVICQVFVENGCTKSADFVTKFKVHQTYRRPPRQIRNHMLSGHFTKDCFGPGSTRSFFWSIGSIFAKKIGSLRSLSSTTLYLRGKSGACASVTRGSGTEKVIGPIGKKTILGEIPALPKTVTKTYHLWSADV